MLRASRRGHGLELTRSVLLPFAAHEMFDLVEQAEHYPQFLPWCSGATILERSDAWVAARLDFSWHQLHFGLATRNPKQRPHSLQVRLVDGPFKHFHGDWHFAPLGAMGCKVSFSLNFDLADGWFDAVAMPAVDAVARTMVDAFVRRAEATLTPLAPGFVPAQEAIATAAHTEVALHNAAAPEPVNTTDHPSLEAVSASPLARFLSPAQVAVLAGVLRAAHYPAHAVLAPEGASDHHLYVVVSGALAVVKHHGQPEETLLTQLGPGEMAHELGFLDGSERYASLVAQRDTQVLVLTRDALESLIDVQPRLLYGVMRSIALTVHRTQTRLALQADELTNYIVKQHGRY
jgi:ribosome-associated toxin RatA of RatAB toxin-antitoxin module/CRP-like cAMP-binding protein